MFAALLILLAVTPPAAATPQSCAGLHCAPLSDTAPESETRFGGENFDPHDDRTGLDRPVSGGIDRRFDNRHDSRFDRQGLDKSGIWPPH